MFYLVLIRRSMTSKIRCRAGFVDSGLMTDENLQHWNGTLVAYQQQISVARKTQQCYV